MQFQLSKSALKIIIIIVLFSLIGAACLPVSNSENQVQSQGQAQSLPDVGQMLPTPLPTRPTYPPGTLVDYTAQSGDTLTAIAAHFNTTVEEIRKANPIIPEQVTTMPPGLPMQIPIYYKPLWGNPFQIIPDSLFINGPAQIGFSAAEFVKDTPGWLKTYREWVVGQYRSGGEIVDFVAMTFSVSPRLLLTLLEYQSGALSQETPLVDPEKYSLDYQDGVHIGVYQQLLWAANLLNNGYYGWRTGDLLSITHLDGRTENPDPWQNAATVALQNYFTKIFNDNDYILAVSGEGITKTYTTWFGDPWINVIPHIEGSLAQPPIRLPFADGRVWAFTGGPHTGWGTGEPLAALDFAPSSVVGGCTETEEYALAVADGVVVRTGDAILVLDLDGDGDERTGWEIFYLHLANNSIVPEGSGLKMGDPVGRPSCEGGKATGTHVHIARKYNGEWVTAWGDLPFNLEGWIAQRGLAEYEGSLTKNGKTIIACECSDQFSQIRADGIR